MHDFSNTLVRLAYRLGFTSIQFGDMKLDMFPDNPYDLHNEPDMFNAWQLGFEDGYQEEFELYRLMET
jgi:hypothetical protein